MTRYVIIIIVLKKLNIKCYINIITGYAMTQIQTSTMVTVSTMCTAYMHWY